ncbi:glycoside hydrolase family 6 protein [Microbispora sp. NPDC046933]|uniref:glycoside hydrolase family 6 protein n=1 Tax=Microbispora sp. NPDC046933 TaxID=3155618 RepID=UPI0033E035F9
MPFGHRRFVRRILTAAAAVVPIAAPAAAGPVLGAASADAAVTCQVTYASTQWGTNSGGFTAGITVRNTGETLTGWKLTFTFPGSQKLTQGWSARWTQVADHVVAENESWNGAVASGGSFQLGFIGTWTGSNPPPADFAVNGVPCQVTGPSTSPSPSAGPSTSPSMSPSTSPSTSPSPGTAGPSPSPSGDVPVDNPFIGAKGYVDPDWAADVESSAAKVDDATAQKMRGLKKTPTAVWLNRIADVTGGSGVARTLKDHLDTAVKQGAGYITLVLHDLPDRDCRSLVSTAELHEQENGLNRYKAEFVDPVAALLARPEYRNLRVAAVVEPRALTDLIVGGVDTYPCHQAAGSGVYVMGIRYALDRLSPLPNVYTYLDAGSAGWAGWETNFAALATSVTETVRGTTAGLNSLDGIATNVADYVPLEEPFLTDPEQTVAGQSILSSRFVDWNPYLNERDYAVAIRDALIAKGFSSSLGVVVDTSRDGWGGPDRPTAVSTSHDLNTYVDQSRVDRRPSRDAMCNQKGAGLGTRPVAAPVPGVDAYLWVKRPGESDGAGGPILPEGSDRLLDPTCDPNGSLRPWSDGFRPTGALPNAPLAGDWHHEQFVMLVNNAYPAL